MIEATDRRFKHGAARRGKITPTFRSWVSMIGRCELPTNPDYARYGGRGIQVCDRWLSSFKAFVEDVGERPAGCTLDRRDCDGDYELKNVRWATPTEQARNRCNNRLLSLGNVTMAVAGWAEHSGVESPTIRARIKRGWSLLDSVFTKSGAERVVY